MLIFAPDPLGTNFLIDTERRDQLFGGPGVEFHILSRDGKTDTIWQLEDGRDRIDLSAFEVTWESVMVRQVSELEWVITIRDERTRIVFDNPAPTDPPIELTADDFIFADDVPPPPVQSIVDGSGRDHLEGTTLPDSFDFAVDYERDVIHRFEMGKDVIDLSAFNTDFDALHFVDKKPGRVVIHVPNDVGVEHIVVKDYNRAFTSADFSADDFLF